MAAAECSYGGFYSVGPNQVIAYHSRTIRERRVDWRCGRYLEIGYDYTLWDVVHEDIEKFRTVESDAHQILLPIGIFAIVIVVNGHCEGVLLGEVPPGGINNVRLALTDSNCASAHSSSQVDIGSSHSREEGLR